MSAHSVYYTDRVTWRRFLTADKWGSARQYENRTIRCRVEYKARLVATATAKAGMGEQVISDAQVHMADQPTIADLIVLDDGTERGIVAVQARKSWRTQEWVAFLR